MTAFFSMHAMVTVPRMLQKAAVSTGKNCV